MKKNKAVYLIMLITAFLIFIIATCTPPGPEGPTDPPTDNKPPEAPVVNGITITNNTMPTWTWNLPDTTVKFRYQLDSEEGAWNEVNSEVQEYTPSTVLSEGNHTLYVQAADKAGNWSASGSFTTNIDLSAPEAPVVNGPQVTNNTMPTWTWTIPSDSTDIRYNLDSGSWVIIGNTTTTSFIPISALSEGDHTLEVQAMNNLGTWSASGSFTINIDLSATEAPVVTVTPLTNDTTPTWSWTIPSDAVDIRYRLNSGSWTIIGNTSITTFTPQSALSENDHTLEVQAMDNADNWSDSGSATVKIDTTSPDAPTVNATSPTSDTTPTWSWNIPSDTSKFRYQLNSESGQWTEVNNATTSYTPSFALSEGNHTLYVQSCDEAGNWSISGEKQINIDLSAPDAPEVSADSLTNDTTPTWTWTIPSSAVNIRYRLNGGSWNTVSTNVTSYTPSNPLSEEDHTLEVQAQDDVGNWSASTSKTVTIDITSPDTPNVDGTTITNNQTPTWIWNVPADTERFRYQLDSETGLWTEVSNSITSYTPSFDLSEGDHTLYVQTCDNIGNWSTSGSFTINIDITAPDAPVVTGTTPTNDTTPTWSWNIPATAVNIRYRLDSGSWITVGNTGTASYTPSAPLSEEMHTIEVQACDEAGNWSDSGSFAITIYIPKPEIKILDNLNNEIQSNNSYNFGEILVNSTSSNISFTIENLGDADLLLSGSPIINISGTNDNEFEITQPITTTISSGTNTTFSIIFKPVSAGNKSALISIVNNDTNENPYLINLNASSIAPEIDILENTSDIISGSDYSFENKLLGSSALEVEFLITNNGTSQLNLTGTPIIDISGLNADEFVVTQPTESMLNAGMSTTFKIKFNPNSVGTKTADISILNDDIDESPFTFTINGEAVSPEINIRNGSTQYLNGGTYDLGDKEMLTTTGAMVMIENLGTADLNLTGNPLVTFSGTNGNEFNFIHNGVSTTISPGESTNIQIYTYPESLGEKSVIVSIDNDDLDEGTYTFTLILNATPYIDDLDSYGVGTYNSLAIDSKNNYHYSYYDYDNKHLKYIKNKSVFTFDNRTGVGKYSSIAVDSNDNPHMAYYDEVNEDLLYASWIDTNWNYELVDHAGSVGKYSKIVIDKNDKMHIAYIEELGFNNSLKYATNESGSWIITTIDTMFLSDVSLAIDSNDKLHISYHADGKLKYATNVDGTWNLIYLDTANNVGQDNSIAIDSNNKIHISYWDSNNKHLKYVTNVTGNWNIYQIDTDNVIAPNSSIVIDKNNDIHISYYDVNNKDLKYITNKSNSWESMILENSVYELGIFSSIAIDNNDFICISYSETLNGKLKLCKIK